MANGELKKGGAIASHSSENPREKVEKRVYVPPIVVALSLKMEHSIAAGSISMRIEDRSFSDIQVEDWKEGGGFDDSDFVITP